jgi:putative transposase
MPKKSKHLVHLTEAQRSFLEKQTKSGDWTPRQVIRAKILLLADVNGPEKLSDEDIVECLDCVLATVSNRRKRFALTKSVEKTIFDKPRSGRPTIVDGAVDAHMTTIACSEAPEGSSQWTLRLIRDRLISLEVIDKISYNTVGRMLKKKKSSRG